MFFHRLMQRSGSFFRKLFLSYLLILLFLCGIMLFLSQQLIRSISVYAESEAKQSVASYRSAIEGVLTSLSTLSQELTTDASLRACIACEGDFPVEIRYGLPQVIDKFGSYKFLNEYLDMIFLYLPAPNYVITDSSAYSPETWCRSFGLDMSFFDDLLRHHAGTMFPLHFSGTMGDKTIVLYSANLPPSLDLWSTPRFLPRGRVSLPCSPRMTQTGMPCSIPHRRQKTFLSPLLRAKE